MNWDKFIEWRHLECLFLMNWQIKIYSYFYTILIIFSLIWYVSKILRKKLKNVKLDYPFSQSNDHLDIAGELEFENNETTPLIHPILTTGKTFFRKNLTSAFQSASKIKNKTFSTNTLPEYLFKEKILYNTQGYKKSLFGSILYYCFILSIIWSKILIITLITIEARISRTDSLETWDERANLFIISWVLGFISFYVARILCHSQNLFFMIECPLYCSTYLTIPNENCKTSNIIFFKDSYHILKIQFSNSTKFVEYLNMRYCYDELTNRFCSYSCQLKKLISNNLQPQLTGINYKDAYKLQSFLGYNSLMIFKKPIYNIQFSSTEEISLILQVFIFWAQIYWKNYLSPIFWILISFYSILRKLYLDTANFNRLKTTIERSDNELFSVIRECKVFNVFSKDLVIGDIILLDNETILPCDILLLDGTAVVDESSLTGESIPSYKNAFSLEKFNEINPNYISDSTETLYGGTRIKNCDALNKNFKLPKSESFSIDLEKKIIGLVISVGCNTKKGRFFESMHESEIITFKYGRQLPTIFFLLGIYAFCCIIIQTFLLNFSSSTFFYGLGTISQVTPIWISSVLYLGQNTSSIRLAKDSKIFCIDSSRISIAGKIRVFCFDKTGTITEDKLNLSGIITFGPHKHRFNTLEEIQKSRDIDGKNEILRNNLVGFLSCHDLMYDENKKLIGSELDLRLFEFAQGLLEVPTTENSQRQFSSKQFNNLKGIVLKKFAFDHSRRCMSVIVQLPDSQTSYVFTKGSSDKIATMCSPADAEDLLKLSRSFSLSGYYVIALAYKKIEEQLPIQRLESITYKDVELNLKVLSILLFVNKIRNEAIDVISKLKNAKIRPVIITGDSAETSYHIGLNSGFFDDNKVSFPIPILFGHVVNNKVIWTDIKSEEEFTSEDVIISKHSSELIIDSECFHHLRASINGRKDEDNLNETILFNHLILRLRIFARMKPMDKTLIIQEFIKRDFITGMIGDGSNDSGALKVAHAGISLSKDESSFFAPFTSDNKSLETVLDLLKEGRASLVTSFSCYKFLILFGLLVAFVKLTLFALVYSIMPEIGYFYMDCLTLIALSRAMTFSRPNKNLESRSPTSSLLGPTTIISVLSIFVVNVLFLIFLFGQIAAFGLHSNLDYNQAIPISAWWMKSDNYEAPCVWIWLCFQLINAAFIFSLGDIFRESVFSNLSLTIWSTLLSFGLFILVISPPTKFTCLFRINCNDEISNSLNIPILKWISVTANGLPFWGEIGNNILPYNWKIRFLLINITNAVVNTLIIKFLIFGAPATYFREKNKTKNSSVTIHV